MTIAPPLRILFIVLACLFGVGLAAGSALSAWDLIEVTTAGEPYGLDGPPPLSFSSYGYMPVTAALVLLSGLYALRRRWDALALTCWFLLGGGALDALLSIWSLAGDGVISAVPNAVGIAWVLFPMIGLALSLTARLGSDDAPGEPASLASQDKARLRNTLVGLAMISYVWRVATLGLSPGATSALAYLRGTTDTYLVLGSIIGVGTAILLLVGIVLSRKENDRFMNAALAFSAGFAFEGFLDAIDLVSSAAARLEVAYALQDGVAFVASLVALALSEHAGRMGSRAT